MSLLLYLCIPLRIDPSKARGRSRFGCALEGGAIPGKIWTRFRWSYELNCPLRCAFLFLFDMFIVYIFARGRLSCRSRTHHFESADALCRPSDSKAFDRLWPDCVTCCVNRNEIAPHTHGVGFLMPFRADQRVTATRAFVSIMIYAEHLADPANGDPSPHLWNRTCIGMATIGRQNGRNLSKSTQQLGRPPALQEREPRGRERHAGTNTDPTPQWLAGSFRVRT